MNLMIALLKVNWSVIAHFLLVQIVVVSNTFTQNTFPESHLGEWHGVLHIYTPEGLQDTVPMTFKLENLNKIDTFAYKLVYHAPEGDDNRAYHLIRMSPNQFLIDELNSIKLLATLFGHKLCSSFRLDHTDIHFHFFLEKEQIVLEILSNNNKPFQTTGGINDVPMVHALRNNVYQRAVLKPVNDK